jgi:hypothetical protein
MTGTYSEIFAAKIEEIYRITGKKEDFKLIKLFVAV